MKYAAYLALMSSVAAKSQEQVELDRIKLVQIVEGVLQGALHAEGFDDINTCIQDAEHLFSDAEVAYNDFKAGVASNVINGIKELADMLKVVKSGMQDCSHLTADWKKMETMISIFNSPTIFAYHVGKDLLLNGKDIFHEIETAVTDYEQSNWKDFGYQIGEAAAKTIVGAQKDELTIDLFTPENFAKNGLIKQLMMAKATDVNGLGDVTYSHCADGGLFNLDTDNTNNTPAPAVKGSDISLNLAGTVTDQIEITNVHVHVDWNGATLYDEDHAQDNMYDSSYNYSLKWSIPSYAPSGAYDIHLTGTGNSSSGPGTEICVEAKMNL